jgi:transcription initiation factor TFIIB
MMYSLCRQDQDGMRVTAASVVRCVCVCLDHLTCTECARILGAPFAAIDLAARKDPPVQLPRVDVGLRPGQSTGGDGTPAEGFGAAGPVRAEGFEAAISGIAARLRLPAAVAERAKEVFRKMEEARAWPRKRKGPDRTKQRSKGALAACISIACRSEGSPRSLRELALATAAKKEEIVRMTALIRRRLGEEEAGLATGVGVVRASEYICHFCSLLRLGDREAAAAKEAARRLEESGLEVPHIGESVAAAVVCMAVERADADRPDVPWFVSVATGVSTVTINTVCKKLRPHAELLFG